MKWTKQISLCFALFFMNSHLMIFAQNRASHTLTVRIIHPVVFSMSPSGKLSETVSPLIQTAASNDENQVNVSWKRTRKPMQITASIGGATPPGECRLQITRPNACVIEDEVRLTRSGTAILQTEAFCDGSCVLDYSRLGRLSEDTTIVYTITEI